MAVARVKSRSARRSGKCSLPVAAAGAAGDKGAMGEKDRAGAMFTLDELAQTIDERAGASAEASYTRSLLDKGAAHCARKFGEEAIEFTIAAAAQDEGAVRAEAADVLYHLLVALRVRGVALSSVMDELGQRAKQSGHQEKASRTK
jgi:phosphoribosyl-ATP pyrophosphohydrolase